MATLQTGTAPNQIPTNGDLGDLAFQSKESVQFTGGRGALSSINLNQIYKEIAATAVDVFVYDTSKDSDGGAWRNRTQHTSWYNETLNTATRGSRREFPSVAVIVATSNAITIYDGDDSNMSMWMVFNEGSGKCLYTNGFSLTAVTALNGILSWAGFRLGVIRFLSDSFSNYEQSFYNYSIKPLSERNGTGTAAYTTSPVILNLYTNDVAMTVLANAPIDAATGLPIPTIAVATNGGTSIIHNNGTVVNITCNNGSYTTSRKVDFLPGGALGLSLEAGSASSEDSYYVFNNIPYASTVITVDTKVGSPISADAFYSAQIVNTAHVSLFTVGNQTDTNRTLTKSSRLNFATPFGLTQIAENRLNPPFGMVNGISSKYNTGWMPGNIKGAWLSDNTAETMVGSELVTNGTFDSNTSGWLANGSGYHTFSAISGALSVTRGSYGLGGGEPYQAVSVISGKFYRVSFVGASGDMSMALGSTIGGSQYVSWNSTGASTLREFTFLATTSTVYILFICNSTGTTASIDNVSIRLADPDRSVNNKGLQVFGSITKTPVATGADLVAYSGFTDNDYLLQPYNSSIDLSTNFTISGWYRTTDTAGVYRGLFYKNTQGSLGDGIQILMNPSNQVYGYVYGTPDDASVVDTIATNDGNWHNVVFTRSGNLITLYIDGNSKGTSSANMGTLTNTNSVTSIGAYSASNAGYYWRGSLALWRVSSTAASAEQIAKMYNDEKYLFQDGAKATLYGTSGSVTALAYDEDTQLLHAGTSSGRSVFRGLRRVDNTTTAVGAAISAANGLVAED